jgi:hypothetical protein
MEQTPISQTQQFVIRITDTDMSFAMRSSGDTAIAFEPYAMKTNMSAAANLREAFRESSMLRRAGQKVTALIDSKVMVVPIEEYQAEDAEEQYNYVYPRQRGTMVVKTVLPALGGVAVYAVNKDIHTVLSDNFEEVRILPLMAQMWEFLMQRSFGGTNKKLYAYFHDGFMDVCSFVRSRFRFCNTFRVADSHDALYFLLGVWKTIGGKAMTDDLFLLGKIPARETLTNDAKQFLRRVYYINPVADFNRADFTQVENMPFDMMVVFGGNSIATT